MFYHTTRETFSEGTISTLQEFSLFSLKQIIPLILMFSSVKSIVSDFHSLKENALKLVKYGKYFIESPSHPADLWRHLQGSVADIQMYNTVKNILNNEETNVKYAGKPYYSTEYLDYITIQWVPDNTSNKLLKAIRLIQIKCRYLKFFKNYALQTFCAKADKIYFKNENKMLERSNAVFGILFSSEYFYYELSKQNNSCISGVDINTDIPLNTTVSTDTNTATNDEVTKIKEKHDKKNNSRKLLASEWIKYCLTPEIIEQVKPKSKKDNNKSVNQYTLQVTDIAYGENTPRRNPFKEFFIFCFTPKLNIPIKKFIAVPADTNPISAGKYICVGGAEQNMALQAFINKYRWRHYDDKFEKKPPSITSSHKELTIGFAENAFDSNIQLDFLAGTEGLVYGVRDIILGRLHALDRTSYKAEVFTMKISKNVTVYSIYGFSALATKIALCQFCNSLEKNGTTAPSQFIPGQNAKPSDIIDYCLINSITTTIFDSPEGKFWDNNDLMNDCAKLKKWLNGEIPEDTTAQNKITTS